MAHHDHIRNGIHNHQHHVHKHQETSLAAAAASGSQQNGDGDWRRPDRFSITVYKNGDEYDPGTKVAVTRVQMPHWISLLDFLTDRLRLTDGSVQKIYTMEGVEIRHFRHFEHSGRYVAAHGRFRRRNYGGMKAKKPPFGVQTAMYEDNNDAGRLGIYSDEGLRHYLRQRDFEPTLGDVWDNSHFDLRGRQQRRTSQQEEAAIESIVHNGHRHQNGGGAKTVGARQHSRLARTEDLAAVVLSRLSNGRSQSVGNGRRQPPAYENGLGQTSNSAESPHRKNQSKIGARVSAAQSLKKSESEQEFRASSLNGNRSKIPTAETRFRHAGRTPAAASPGRHVFEGDGASYDIFEMAPEEGRMVNGSTKSRIARGGGRGRVSTTARMTPGVGRGAPPNGRTTGNRKSGSRLASRIDRIEAEIEAEEVIDPEAAQEIARERAEELIEELIEEGRAESRAEAIEEIQEMMAEQGLGDDPSPQWATELTTAVRELASEVHHLHPPLTTETLRNFRTKHNRKSK